MIKKLCNLYIRHKTKNLTRIPLFTMTFDWKKFQKDGKENSCMLVIYLASRHRKRPISKRKTQ